MDDMTVKEFLFQIGPDFAKFADKFIKHKFHNVASLRCLKIPEDINFILGDELSLGELRQIENSLNELKSISTNQPKNAEKYSSTTVMKKICVSAEEKIREKKKELHELEKVLAQLEMPISEPEPQGNMHYRCTNCHIRGHKADNNKGSSVCQNEKCTDYRFCGQKDKHKEYREDKKKLQSQIKNLKNEIIDCEDEIVRASAYEAKSATSFTKVVKERLRKTNPTKYAQCSVLMRDLMLLKSAYENKIPSVSQNDKKEFSKILTETNYKIKKEYDSDSSSTDSPPSKKMCTVPPAPQEETQMIKHQMHFSDYVYSPDACPPRFQTHYPANTGNFIYGFPTWYQPQMSQEVPVMQHPGFFTHPQFVPMLHHPPTPFYVSNVQPSVTATKCDSSDLETVDNTDDKPKPKIWSPAFM